MKEKIRCVMYVLLTLIIVSGMITIAIRNRKKPILVPDENETNQRDLVDVINHNHTI